MHLSKKESLVMRSLNAHPNAMHLAGRLNNKLLSTPCEESTIMHCMIIYSSRNHRWH